MPVFWGAKAARASTAIETNDFRLGVFMSDDATRAKIRAFLAEHIREADTVTDDDDLFGSGLVNSLFAMQLVMFVESTFGLTVDNEDLDLENFRSIDAIAGLIARKSAAVA